MLTPFTNQNLLKNYFKDWDWINPYSITLTMKNSVWRDVSVNFKHFMNRLNQKYLGNRFRRFNEGLRVIPIIEGSEVINPHYHCLIDNPFIDRDDEFNRLIKECWWKTELSKPEVDIQKTYDVNGWINYMVKMRSKSSVTDSIDWNNVNR